MKRVVLLVASFGGRLCMGRGTSLGCILWSPERWMKGCQWKERHPLHLLAEECGNKRERHLVVPSTVEREASWEKPVLAQDLLWWLGKSWGWLWARRGHSVTRDPSRACVPWPQLASWWHHEAGLSPEDSKKSHNIVKRAGAIQGCRLQGEAWGKTHKELNQVTEAVLHNHWSEWIICSVAIFWENGSSPSSKCHIWDGAKPLFPEVSVNVYLRRYCLSSFTVDLSLWSLEVRPCQLWVALGRTMAPGPLILEGETPFPLPLLAPLLPSTLLSSFFPLSSFLFSLKKNFF